MVMIAGVRFPSKSHCHLVGFPWQSESSCDQMFVIDWAREDVLTSWTVAHSPHFKSAVQLSNLLSGWDDEDDGDHIAGIKTLLAVVSPEEFYVLHSEVVMPEVGTRRELQDWGHHIKVWRVNGKETQLVFSKRDARVVSFTGNLLIYEEVTNFVPGVTGEECFGTTLINFKDVGKTVHWLNMETGTDCHQQTFCSDFRPLHTAAVMEDGTIQVLQLFFEENSDKTVTQDRFIMFELDMKETTQAGRVVHFPKLLHGNELGDNFDLELLSDGKLYFAHQVLGWSNGTLPTYPGTLKNLLPLAVRVLVLEEGGDKPNVEIWNCDDTRGQITGCYPYVFSDLVMR